MPSSLYAVQLEQPNYSTLMFRTPSSVCNPMLALNKLPLSQYARLSHPAIHFFVRSGQLSIDDLLLASDIQLDRLKSDWTCFILKNTDITPKQVLNLDTEVVKILYSPMIIYLVLNRYFTLFRALNCYHTFDFLNDFSSLKNRVIQRECTPEDALEQYYNMPHDTVLFPELLSALQKGLITNQECEQFLRVFEELSRNWIIFVGIVLKKYTSTELALTFQIFDANFMQFCAINRELPSLYKELIAQQNQSVYQYPRVVELCIKGVVRLKHRVAPSWLQRELSLSPGYGEFLLGSIQLSKQPARFPCYSDDIEPRSSYSLI